MAISKKLNKNDIIGAIDDIPCLWKKGYSLSHGENDRVRKRYLKNLTIEVTHEYKLEHRANFCFKNIGYKLKITDPKIRHDYPKINSPKIDKYHCDDALICVSLAKEFKLYADKESYAYKLVASVIT